MTAYAIDDYAGALAILVDFCKRTEGLELLGYETDPQVAASALNAGLRPDILFVDIEMPGLNGFEFLELIPPGPSVIFTTAHKQFAFDAFDRNAIDYLHKPFGYGRFLKAIYKARKLHDSNFKAYTGRRIPIKISGKGNFAYLLERDIEMLESKDGKLLISLIDGETIISPDSMEIMLDKLKGGSIFQIHRSFAVNVEQIRKISATKVMLVSKKVVPVGDSYRSDLYGLIDAPDDQ